MQSPLCSTCLRRRTHSLQQLIKCERAILALLIHLSFILMEIGLSLIELMGGPGFYLAE